VSFLSVRLSVSYIALRFDADAAATDLWSDALIDAGALSVEISDPAAGTLSETAFYGEPGVEMDARWPTARVMALFPAGVDAALALAKAGADLGLAPPPHAIHAVAEQDWVRAAQAQFAPLHIHDRLWIVPSWCEAPDPSAINVTLDPGQAFGTGSHPTTRLCLEWLAREMPQDATVLDYGCGSGILAIAAAKLGARHATGVDVDAEAVDAARANAAANRVAAIFTLADTLDAGGHRTFDVVVANILATPLRLLAPALATRTRTGGSIVLSGVLADQAAEVLAAYSPWFIMNLWKSGEDGWVALAGVRRKPQAAA
jgi:ribosomal protein L11 methyltransferase